MTKERLKKYRDITKERDHLAQIIEELDAKLYGPKGINYDGMPHGNGGESYVKESQIDSIRKLKCQYYAKVAELTAELVDIEAAIECLEPRERSLIRLYYIDGLTWEEVCVHMNYCWRQVHRIHAKALEALKTEQD